MSGKKAAAKSKPQAKSQPAGRDTGEERGADAATIAWMLSAVATLAAELVAGVARLVTWLGGDERMPPVARILPTWFLLCAVITGLLCLALTPLVYRLRRVKPPRSITITVLIIGLLPLIVLAMRAAL